MPIRLVVADDHPLILDGLRDLFTAEKDLPVVALCHTAEEALQAVRKHRPDVLVLDLRMPGLGGMGILRAMSEDEKPTVTVLYTAVLDQAEMLEAIRFGVRGVVLKEMPPRLLVECVRAVAAGKHWLEKNVANRAIETMLRREAGARDLKGLLTDREIAITCAVANGLRNKAIGDRLHISEGTVKVHLHNIYQKLELDGRLALTVYARTKGLV
jgi:DNA-binding NarL/FixJ family response regulator